MGEWDLNQLELVGQVLFRLLADNSSGGSIERLDLCQLSHVVNHVLHFNTAMAVARKAIMPLFTDLFHKEYEQKFDISEEMVRQTLSSPTRRQKLLASGVEFSLYLKKMNPDYLLVLSDVRGGDMTINAAYWLKPDLVGDVSPPDPLPLLQLLASRYGLTIRIGQEQGTFIHNALIPVDSTNARQIVKINNPENHSFQQNFWIRIIPNQGGSLAQVALAYCLDTYEYLKWIRQ